MIHETVCHHSQPHCAILTLQPTAARKLLLRRLAARVYGSEVLDVRDMDGAKGIPWGKKKTFYDVNGLEIAESEAIAQRHKLVPPSRTFS
jgi:hypothetical protein